MAAPRRLMLDALLTDLDAVVDRVRETQVRERTYRFGSRPLTVRAHDPSSVVPPGALTAAAPGTQGKAVLHVVDADTARAIRIPKGAVLGPYGGVLATSDLRWIVLTNPDTGRLLALDRERREALYAPGSDVPPREVAEFCRPLVHWLAILDGNVVIHAGAVATEGRGVLIAGNGNAGKTTLTRLCLAAGFSYLGDNVVEVERGTRGMSRLHSVYPSFKLRRDPAMPVPADWPTPQWDPEPAKDIYLPAGSGALAFAAEPVAHAATLVLDAVGPDRPTQLGAAAAFFRIAPNTVAQFPFFAQEVLTRAREVSAQVVTYEAGRMPVEEIPGLVRELVGA